MSVISVTDASRLLNAAYQANVIGKLANGEFVVCHENGWFGVAPDELAEKLSKDINGIDTLLKALKKQEVMPPNINSIRILGVELDFSDETSLGEPQAWVYLDSGESIEITHEEDGLDVSDMYYSVRLHCSEEDFEKDLYHKTMGVIQEWYCESLKDVERVLSGIKSSVIQLFG